MNALIIVDLQNDFVEGGALAVPGGNEIIPLINRIQPEFDVVVATQDWHPPDHGSFAANHPGKAPGDVVTLNGLQQILWPIHCVQDTPGSQFVSGLNRERWSAVFRKGTDPAVDSYSGFFDNHRRHSTGLGNFLKETGVSDIFVVGLATEYCVKATAIDGAILGFRVTVIKDGCRGLNLQPGDLENAFEEMRDIGVNLIDHGAL
jgi:nicotinamidase/pyrazinamidase